ncbi:MAG: hypothetical protein FD143_1353 [Ignavibacteria bacterium]|nr:MAG: hypothetical protein FD143_1353 [Ignavibacteria bacterium]KAF0160659.1 MAG: hypothetical protein FD188_1566 [Ignavibacteria bacterium]
MFLKGKFGKHLYLNVCYNIKIMGKKSLRNRVTKSIGGKSKLTEKNKMECVMNNYNLVTKKALLLLGTLAFLSSFGYAHDLRVLKEKTFQMKDYQNLFVEVSGADVKVENWGKQEVYVKISGNEKAAAKLKYDVFQDGDVVRVIIKKKDSFWNWFGSNVKVEVEAFVPSKFNANVKTSGGDITAKGISGGFSFGTSGGDINLKNLNGKVNAETSGGDIHLFEHKGSMYLSTSGGDIICKIVAGDVKAETSGGDINVDQKEGRLFAETSGGDITIVYSGVNKGIEASTSGGDITAKLPSDFKAKVHLHSSGGSVKSNFNNVKTTNVKRSQLDAEYNGGGPSLRLETSGGDVHVHQK